MTYYPAAFINEISENGTKEEAVKWLQSTWNDYMEASNKLAELTEQRDEYRKDAERYRWLRANGEKGIYVLRSGWKQEDEVGPLALAQGEELDCAIDDYLAEIKEAK